MTSPVINKKLTLAVDEHKKVVFKLSQATILSEGTRLLAKNIVTAEKLYKYFAAFAVKQVYGVLDLFPCCPNIYNTGAMRPSSASMPVSNEVYRPTDVARLVADPLTIGLPSRLKPF